MAQCFRALLQRTGVQLPALTQWLTIICNSRFWGADTRHEIPLPQTL